MKKKALRFIIWVSGSFLVLLLTFVLVLYANKDRVINRVVSEANKILTEPVDLSSLDISIDQFPSASILLTDVYCKGISNNPTDTLIYAEHLYLEFHLWKLVLGDWSIEGITLENGKLMLNFPENGTPNYRIWNNSKEGTSTSVFNLEKVHLKDILFKLAVEKQKIDLSAQVNSGILAGIFENGHYELESEADFLLTELIYQENEILQPENLKAKLKINGTEELIQLQNGLIELSGINVSFTGEHHPNQLVLHASGSKVDITDLQQLYQKQRWSDKPIDANLKGKLGFEFAGLFPYSEESPQYQIKFDINKGSITEASVKLTSINIQGSYKRGHREDKIVLEAFKGNGRTGQIAGSMSISDLSSPAVNLKLIGDLELAEWMLLLPLDTLTDTRGRMAVNLNLSNNFNTLTEVSAEELRKTQAHGQIELMKVGFGFVKSDKIIRNLNASLNFGQDQLDIDNFYFQTGESDVYLSGHFSNVLGYLFFEKEKLKLDTRVRSQELHVEDFLLSGRSRDGEYSLEFARSIEMDLVVEVDQFYFDSFYAEDVEGNLAIRNNMITGNKLMFEADEGIFKGNFSINMKELDNYRLMANLTASNADLHELFVSFNDFGQKELVADNIYGRADMNLRMTSTLEPNLVIPPESVFLKADLNIKHGVLKNYQPMLALSDYADIDELSEVKFSQLTNQISIEESVIYIPEMLIASNVLNLQLSGQHHFDNSIDYTMRLRLADVLFKNRKKKNQGSEFDEHLIEMEKTDDPNIYVSMTGTASYPIISLDKDEMNRSIKEDLKQQGQELKQIFTKKDPGKSDKKSSGIEYTLFEDEEEGAEK